MIMATVEHSRTMGDGRKMAGLNCAPAVITKLRADRAPVPMVGPPVRAGEKTEEMAMSGIEPAFSNLAH
jgi:hypothetical protein